MSNKIVPNIYRAVIDDVIANIKSEFDEYGVGEEVLAELQHKWEAKVIQSHVAEFEASAPQAAHASAPAPPQHSYPPHPIHAHAMHNSQYQPAPGAYHAYAPPSGPHIKAEPVDQRYMLSGPPTPYAIPSLPGPQIHRPSSGPVPPPPTARLQYPPSAGSSNGVAPTARIPQVDGPSSSSSDSPSPPPSQSYAPPRALHPSLPQPAAAASASHHDDDDEAINSDLDDSDSDNERDDDANGAGDTDIVFCTYDKASSMTSGTVARVKNKWKCVLKDGMIHVNGKDYLFAKCTGEFEW
ncbi:transcription factor IIA alpha/beta subunit [Cristinia sonorae]|uniref:Transcription initiation factor IIA large subunit n=1 Tax=Cristinia sonorae TaxID=1940300 RepID=A0A8K0UZQ4_9AGAR|nr:transcription factor IIA alpha/beta subunit [Cristinia sonorae]